MTTPATPEPEKPPENPAAPEAPKRMTITEAIGKAKAEITAAETKPAETPETPPPAEGETPPAETPPAETETPPPAEGETPPAEEIVVELPPRRQGEEPFQLAVEDQETAERLNQLAKMGLRREELNRHMEAVNRRAEELDLVEQHLQIDPVGFLIERVKPEIQIPLAKHLLSIPEVFQAVSNELIEWSADENIRARRQAELGRERADGRRKAERELAVIAEARQQGRLVRDTVEGIIPGDMPEDEATMFRDDCLADVAGYCRAHPEVRRLRPEEVVGIIERRLRHYRVTPESALAALSSGQPFRRPTAAGSKPSAPGTPDAEEARTAGAKLKQAGEARRAAAAVPGAGAGARPTKLEPPAQQGVKDRIKWARQLFGKG